MKEELVEEFSLYDSTDADVLMHRDAHFSGKFDLMIDYYEREGKGMSCSFDLDDVYRLADMERQMNQNLAAIILSGAQAEKVAKAREAYHKLRELYERPTEANRYARLLTDLILSEEANPEAEIAAIVNEKGSIVPSLIHLLKTEEYYDPLFPGYGHAPTLAAYCLGKIGDKRSIIALFESIGEGDFFDEDVSLQALKAIGAPAKEFLLKVIHGRPINSDNERAAIALIQFKEEPDVSKACLDLLKDSEVQKHIAFSTYLALGCEGLTDEASRKEFIALANDPKTDVSLRKDMMIIGSNWKS